MTELSMDKQNRKNMPPLVSVCIPVYNGAKYIREAIRSVIDQRYPNLEILVQDNASTDATPEILQELARLHPQLSFLRNDVNIGMAPNWNAVIERAHGDYIMLLSADDYLEPEFLAACLDVFATTDSSVVTTNHYWLIRSNKTRRIMPISGGTYRDFTGTVLILNPFSINFTLFSRNAVERLKQNGRLFKESIVTCDYDLWIRLASTDMITHYITLPLGTYRVHDENISRQKIRMNREAADVVLDHRQDLVTSHPVVYRLTIARFIARIFFNLMRFRKYDKDSLQALYHGW